MDLPPFPQSLKELYEFLVVCIVILLSSIAGMLRRHREKKSWICLRFCADLFVSVITGLTAFILILGVTHNDWLAVGGASYCGHLGPRGLEYISEHLKDYIKPRNG